jgi:hypothetical protein
MRRAGSLIVLATILATPGSAHNRSRCKHDHEHHRRTCGSISVTSPDRPRARERFSAAKTLDLEFEMRLRKGREDEDPQLVRFRVLTPKGHLYQEIQTAPQRAERRRRGSTASGQIPVAGTFIATSSLFGRWRVVPYLDDDPKPCGAAAVFSIVE